MKLRIKDAPAFKAAIDAIVNLVEEGQFEVREEGLRFRAMDPSQISMISFFMPKDSFLEYNLSEATKIGVDINQFSSFLSRGKKDEEIEISIEENRLVLKFIGKKHTRTFKIPLIEAAHGIQKEPPIEFQSYALVKADILKDIMKDVKLISSHVKLQLKENKFIVDVKEDGGEVKVEFESGGEEVKELKTETGERATYPLQYLEDMLKAAPNNEYVKINLETDKPLKLEYTIEGAKIVYYLAPRIETE